MLREIAPWMRVMDALMAFPAILLAAGLVGVGSSTFHPETSRVARLASGGRYGLAQSTFQVGGNTGSALGPLLAAAIIATRFLSPRFIALQFIFDTRSSKSLSQFNQI